MTWKQLVEPAPLLIPAVLLGFFFWRCLKWRRWPDMDKCVELIAFSAGFYISGAMVWQAVLTHGQSQTTAWALLTGAVVTGLASARGAWLVFSAVRSRAEPQKEDGSPDERLGDT